ncbi:MAG TPA: transporter substrate-binding domain-containing protein, partial [Oceanobacillus sp.]|nr:transporter substrate-binding domain-containing protein [Oceanobacillus sp.]
MQARIRVGLMFCLLLALIAPFSVLAQDGELPDLEGREVTIAVENAYPPYNYINEAGEAVGWDYDTFNEICARINCVPVYVEMGW